MDCDCTALGALPLILTKRISVWGRDGDGEPREGGALREKGEIEAGEISEGPQAKGGGGWGRETSGGRVPGGKHEQIRTIRSLSRVRELARASVHSRGR